MPTLYAHPRVCVRVGGGLHRPVLVDLVEGLERLPLISMAAGAGDVHPPCATAVRTDGEGGDPLARAVAGGLKDYLHMWETYYFYTAAS
jgi:hypothetical protein